MVREQFEGVAALSTWLGILKWLIPVLLNYGAALGVTFHAVLRKRDTRAAIGWVGLAWLAPIVGPLAYVCFGINRIQRKAVSLRIREGRRWQPEVPLDDEDLVRREEVEAAFPGLVGLARLNRELNGRRLTLGNSIEPLINGDDAFPVMLEAIDQATKSVSLLSYIFDNDDVGQMFLESLVRAQQRNVQVRVLVDHVGASYSRPTIVRRLRAAGITARTFLPTRAPRLAQYANLRNHRKLMVVDGHTAFTGGTNIRHHHWLSRGPDFPTQCIHFMLRGPIVEQIQEAFAVDWAFTTGESLQGDAWFPEVERAGRVWARGIPDGPDEDFERISYALIGALASASRSVRIVTPYFLPHAALIEALNVTALRGVRVDIVIPAVNNQRVVQWATTGLLWQVLEKGCRVFASPPPFDHSKLMVVDEMWSLIGSSNWDPRSLRLNFEFNVECYDAQLAASLTRLINDKINVCHRITLDEVNQRSMPIQLRDGLCRLFTPYL